MKKKIILLSVLLLVGVLLLPNCASRRFETPAFYHKAEGHRVIAILPYEMVFTGKKPKNLTVQQIREIEERESLAFQSSLYRMLYRQSMKRYHPVRINIQTPDETNNRLDRQGIDLRQSWELSSRELAEVLQVDAVVRTRVVKKRYMSGLASFGVELGNAILNELLEDTPLQIFVPNPTKGIKAECTLFNGRDGDTLWAIDINEHIDWKMSANDIVDHINRFFARKFPYR